MATIYVAYVRGRGKGSRSVRRYEVDAATVLDAASSFSWARTAVAVWTGDRAHRHGANSSCWVAYPGREARS